MPRQPNILHIFTDQQRADTIAALGNPVIRTPSLDRLASQSVAFTNAYTPSPVCVSARCSMIYGQYPHATGCYDNRAMPEDNRQSFMGALAEAGYRTHGVGKCHFMPDRQAMRGFQTRERQEELVPSPEADDYLPFLQANGFGHITDPHGVRGETYYVPQPAQMPARLHPSQWVGDRSVAFIEKQASAAQPWYLFASFVHPHPPFAPPAPWHKLYRAPLMPLPVVPQDWDSLLIHINRRQNRNKYRDQGIDLNLVRCIKAYYYAAISFVDFQVGRILDALDRAGRADNTMVIFTSDHGEHLGDYNCFGKRSMHNTCARIPMLVRAPGVFAPGARCSRPASLVDVAPTILARAGASIASHGLQGMDLAGLASGASQRDMVFSQFQNAGHGVYMAADERWKYFYSAPDNRDFLFDRLSDPLETRNLAGVSFRRDEHRRMKSALIAHLRAGGETAALDGDDWKTYPTLPMPANPDEGLGAQDHAWPDMRLPGYNEG